MAFRSKRRFIPAHAGNTPLPLPSRFRLPVHPRTRGEHWSLASLAVGTTGSSPHTRGTHAAPVPSPRLANPVHPRTRGEHCSVSASLHQASWPVHPRTRGEHRLTPSRSTVACDPVHPRTRGEHATSSSSEGPSTGSSPHTRGTPLSCASVGHSGRRFIPAHAGNTPSASAPPSSGPVHPRTRGEHDKTATLWDATTGSSPHTRGTRGQSTWRLTSTRFIPAHAGNTAFSVTLTPHISVHPRTRGEHREPLSIKFRFDGSSPHTRGTLSTPVAVRQGPRFIPAHAGNTLPKTLGTTAASVHPRTRGEHVAAGNACWDYDGSSPHTRGTHRTRHSLIAPAPVHPRTRGEHVKVARLIDGGDGSSPHTRGTHRIVLDQHPENRFIPAHAGNTHRPCTEGLEAPVHPRTRGEHERPTAGQRVAVRFIPAHAGNTQ